MPDASAKSRRLEKAIAPRIAKQASQNSDFYLQNCQILDIFLPIQVASVVGKRLWDIEMPSRGLKPLHT